MQWERRREREGKGVCVWSGLVRVARATGKGHEAHGPVLASAPRACGLDVIVWGSGIHTHTHREGKRRDSRPEPEGGNELGGDQSLLALPPFGFPFPCLPSGHACSVSVVRPDPLLNPSEQPVAPPPFVMARPQRST